ncbi:STAS domain-containing protein [Tautonia plasticadhaerens]|uniref:FHA domain protein n=1 Tax=Tautonia plasticadhaerens TaxID=2527974 RepID=A0A518H7J8_9BACT|nr:STAS domain-containing protein [Tautonia plasticadhaerens]QDV36761.1 FHA domain protein [Tautonia plasticadhaerens]
MDRALTSTADQAVRGPGDAYAPSLDSTESDRRLEDWIASRLEGKPDRPRHSTWSIRMPPEVVGGRAGDCENADFRAGTNPGWKRVNVDPIGDVIVVTPVDSQLLGEVTLAELRSELFRLCDAGCGRLVLNLARVDRFSSQFLELLITLDRHCSMVPGGTLRVCMVGPELARLLAISGLDRRFGIAPDLPQALAAPWPSTPRTVPVEILEELIRRPTSPTTGEEAPDPSPAVPPPGAGPTSLAALVIRVAGTEPRVVPIPEAGLRIGRDASCEVLVSDPAVSRVHAWVGPRDGRLTLEDLGSTNGTSISGRVIRAEGVWIRAGSEFSIGPGRFGLSDAPDPIVEDILDEWSHAPEAPESVPGPTMCLLSGSGDDPDADPHAAGDPFTIRCEAIEGVLVLTPMVPRLDDEAAIGPIRDRIDALIRESGPTPRIVVNLAPLVSLSGRGIGLLLSQQLRLRREGGGVRLAQPNAAVATAMEIVSLSTLIETFPTIHDAVLTRWAD